MQYDIYVLPLGFKIYIMSSNGTYVSDKELTELYNCLEKKVLVELLIKKYRESEKRIRELTTTDVNGSLIKQISECQQIISITNIH